MHFTSFVASALAFASAVAAVHQMPTYTNSTGVSPSSNGTTPSNGTSSPSGSSTPSPSAGFEQANGAAKLFGGGSTAAMGLVLIGGAALAL